MGRVALARLGRRRRRGRGAFELPVDLPSRISDTAVKTSPEELLAAAHATCYVTSLAGEIARAGGTVERIDLTCTVTMDEVGEKGHLIVASEIDARARAEGIDQAGSRASGAGGGRGLSVLDPDPGERFR